MEKYSVIYANPPWMYNKHFLSLNAGQDDTETVKPHHNLIPVEEIMSLPVQKICEDNCILFLWATTPILPEALDVMAAWGFAYKTLFTWEKTNDNCMGYWFKTCTEHLIVAIKGNVKSFRSNVRNCYHEAKRRYGKKPDYFYWLIENITEGRKIELFAKNQRKGWDVWNKECENSVLFT
jgi:Transcriptional activator, adenine-specific DNA methyltransferase